MSDQNKCVCSGSSKLIFSCSGAADVGEIADRVARKMTKDKIGKMFCLAGIGGRVEGIMKTTEAADKILAIDGCGLDCTKKTLVQAGFKDYRHMRVTDLGLEKGSSPATEENVNKVKAKAQTMLDNIHLKG